MIYLSHTGNRDIKKHDVPIILLAISVTVFFMQGLPVLSFFFAVPLFIVLFICGEFSFIFSVFLVFFLEAGIVIFQNLKQGIAISNPNLLIACCVPGFFILPLLTVPVMKKMRLRYRLTVAGLLSATAWACFFLISGTESFTALLTEFSQSAVDMLSSGLSPEAKTEMMNEISSASLYPMLRDVVTFSVLPTSIFLYAFDFIIAMRIIPKKADRTLPVFRIIGFYNDSKMAIPLLGGMCGVIAAFVLKNRILTIVSWNIVLSAALFFCVQGWGIFLFFGRILVQKTGMPRFLLPIGILLLFVFIGYQYLFILLAIVGAVEIFVPLRSRFNKTDIIDPTPGDDNDGK